MINYQQAYPALFAQLQQHLQYQQQPDIDVTSLINHQPTSEATRVSSGRVLTYLARYLPMLIGGSADLGSSTKAFGGADQYSISNPTGQELMFGVREFAMGCINNGLTLHGGWISFVSTFLCFLDYLKPALRLAALMQINNWWIFTHDSILVGEDGPTHQPVEHLAMVRAQPNLISFRPADYNEVLGSYMFALNNVHRQTPFLFILSRQPTPQLQTTAWEKVKYGAYCVWKNKDVDDYDLIITSTGTEVAMSIACAKIIASKWSQIKVQVVSMVSWKLFEQQPLTYRSHLYQVTAWGLKVTFELGSTFGWQKYGDFNIGWDQYGQSASAEQTLIAFRLTPNDLAEKIIGQLKNKGWTLKEKL